MKRCLTVSILLLALGATSSIAGGRTLRARIPHYHSIHSRNASVAPSLRNLDQENLSQEDIEWQEFLRLREPQEIISSLDSIEFPLSYNPLIGPRLYPGYQPISEAPQIFSVPNKFADIVERDSAEFTLYPLAEFNQAMDISQRLFRHRYRYMIQNPEIIEFASWQLPEPPQLPPEDFSFSSYLRRMKLPTLSVAGVGLTKRNIERINWLHTFNGGIQFSQAYISRNWYQGGNDHLSLLINFYWNVQLNQAYHPNLLFQNTFSYKLGLNSTSHDEYHKYSISEDLFQWNMNFGVKARDKWYYSLTGQFKTQLLNSYAENSMTRTAAFLSPGDLNVGLGMTYSTINKYKTFQLKVAISPLSYNLKTCFDTHVDATQFGFAAGKKILNEVGSSAEASMQWDITGNINYKTRFFVFTDYKNYSQDWENTLSFAINKFLSTQIYAHLRYDTAGTAAQKWGHWMLKEILSFGFAYTFSTK